ncbi:hypothetical protein DNK57_01860 [Methanothermobacter thermautotrophicus]|uniref:dolichyl-phosphooligosaccharide-protein glycotransferase n=1 Tax=Methanothermobacter thermautotrophicus TaxID=145262 RepID=A0A842YJP7_METTF|nr:STT3 domain-containing protein [Methanothermobacter thermautotrophicus]MBE2899576.1 hypothetical protein [Methanothermobacter thermautotrophicus]
MSFSIREWFGGADRKAVLLMLLIFASGFALRAGTVHAAGVYSEAHSQPLMYDMDSYYNLRLASNLLNEGELSEGGWDRYSYYPPGVPLDYPPLLPYLTVTLYLLFTWLLPGLTDTAFWLPAIIAPLTGVAVFAVARSLDCDDVSATTAGLLATAAPFYFMRTVPGFYDTDMFNLLLPLAVLLTLHLSLRDGDWRMAVLSGALMAVFSTAWNGWQIIYSLMILAVILHAIIYHRREPIIFLLTSTLLIVLLDPLAIPSIPLGLMKIPMATAHPFPNPYVTITELQRPGFEDVVMALGPGLLLAGLAGFRPLLRDWRESIVLPATILWTITGAMSLLWGIRFSELLTAPLLITSALFLADLRVSSPAPEFRRSLQFAVAIMVVLPSLIICLGQYSALHPRVDDGLLDAAAYIRDETPPDTVVICNWVHGHFFAFMAHRPVNFDGRLAYIETLARRGPGYPLDPRVPGVYREYWQDRALATTDPYLADEILSMMASSGDEAYLEILNATGDPAGSAVMLRDAMAVDGPSREAYLKGRGLDWSAASRVASTLSRSSGYVLVTYDRLIDKGYWIFYYGNWNFTGKTREPVYSTGGIIQGWPLRSSDGLFWDGERVTFNGLKVSGLYLVDGGIRRVNGDPDGDLVAFVLYDRNRTVVLERRYEDSMFTRLVLLGDGGGVFRAVMRSGDVTVWEPRRVREK